MKDTNVPVERPKRKVVLQINSGIMTRRIPMPDELFQRVVRGQEFKVPVKKIANLSDIRALSDALTPGMAGLYGIPSMVFKFYGKTEGSDRCPVLELSSFEQ